MSSPTSDDDPALTTTAHEEIAEDLPGLPLGVAPVETTYSTSSGTTETERFSTSEESSAPYHRNQRYPGSSYGERRQRQPNGDEMYRATVRAVPQQWDPINYGTGRSFPIPLPDVEPTSNDINSSNTQ